MGLPSGTKWARYDIDVTQPDNFCASEFQYGKSFFSWANVQGHNPVNGSFENVYDWGGVNAETPWYEGQPYGDTPGAQLQGDIIESADYDAAISILGAPWHMPTKEQFAELFENVDFLNDDGTIKDPSLRDKRSTVNGVVGIWIQSKINGNRMFFACSGFGDGRSWLGRGTGGDYWSTSYVTVRYAKSLYIGATGVNPQVNDHRHYGFVIRPVQSE